MAADTFTTKDWPELERLIADRAINAFPTKKAAIQAGSEYGWRECFKLIRRFEHVWIVGKKDFQNSIEAGVEMEVIRVPLLRWDDSLGVKKNPVLELRRMARKAA